MSFIMRNQNINEQINKLIANESFRKANHQNAVRSLVPSAIYGQLLGRMGETCDLDAFVEAWHGRGQVT